MKDKLQTKGSVTWEIWKNGKWEFAGDNHNVTTLSYRNALASSSIGGSQVIFDKMTAGTNNTSFTSSSVALGNEIASTTTFTATISGGFITQSVGVVLFDGSYTIQEVGLWDGSLPIAFANINQAVTALAPLRVTWNIYHL